MFTGLVQQRGRLIEAPQPVDFGGRVEADDDRGDRPVRLQIAHGEDLSSRLELGASLAVNGVCLTVIEMTAGRSTVELSPETLSRTTLGDLGQDSEVNLEPAMRLGDALGGHWVQGHVDATLAVVGRRDLDQHRELEFELPPALRRYVVEKGSVTLDGVSLTVARREEDRFSVALIPHTLEVTTLSRLRPGDRVNVEVDILAKYVENAVACWAGEFATAGQPKIS